MSTILTHPTWRIPTNRDTIEGIITEAKENLGKYDHAFAVALACYGTLPAIIDQAEETSGPTVDSDRTTSRVLTRVDGHKMAFWVEYDEEHVTGWTYAFQKPDEDDWHGEGGNEIDLDDADALVRMMASGIIDWADKATPLVQASASDTDSGVEINLNGDTIKDALDDLLDYLNTAAEPEKPFTITRMTVDDQEVDNIDGFDPLTDMELEVTIEGAYGDSAETVCFLAISEC